MPFENLSGNQKHDYFSIGFVEDVNSDVAHFANLRVIASSTARRMGREGQDAQAAAKSLGIDYLLRATCGV